MCEQFYQSHLLAPDNQSNDCVLSFFKFFVALSGCEGIVTKDETAESKRSNGEQPRWEKNRYLVNSNVKMTARLQPSYVHNNVFDTSCCKMRHFTKAVCGICLDSYSQD